MFQSVFIESCDVEMFGRNPRIAFFRQPLELSWRGRVKNNMPFIRMFFFANPCPIDSSLQLPVRRDWGSCIRPQRSGSHNLVSNAHKAENMTNKERRRRNATREDTQRLRKERFLPKQWEESERSRVFVVDFQKQNRQSLCHSNPLCFQKVWREEWADTHGSVVKRTTKLNMNFFRNLGRW